MTTCRRPTWLISAVLCGVTLACGGSTKATGSNPGAEAGSGDQSQGAAAGTSGAPSTPEGGNAGTGGVAVGGCGSAGCGPAPSAGTGGEPEPEVCDQACLDSVVSQNGDFGDPLQSSWFLVGCRDRQNLDCVNAFPAGA